MQIAEAVHKKRKIPRGIRLEEDVWDFIDRLAETTREEGAAQVITRWAREKMEAVRAAA